jgi:hypothetical protein
MLVDAVGVFLPNDPDGNAKLVFSILDCLPKANRVSVSFGIIALDFPIAYKCRSYLFIGVNDLFLLIVKIRNNRDTMMSLVL